MREATAPQGTAVLPQICALSQSWKVWQQIPLETISGLIRSIGRNVTFIEILVNEALQLFAVV